MGLLVAGTKYRGEFEERLKKLMEEIKQADDIILVIDEVHTLIGAGAAEGAIDAANILKPALARGELQVSTWPDHNQGNRLTCGRHFDDSSIPVTASCKTLEGLLTQMLFFTSLLPFAPTHKLSAVTL